MKVILAKKAGFCMGVRRAVETVLDTLRQEEGDIATFGPLIHNPQVLELLSKRGVRILKEIPAHPSGTIVIRAHGVPPAHKARLAAEGAKVVDATCPRVIKVQAIIKKFAARGYTTVIIGDKKHAEVEGLMGYAEPRVVVVSGPADAAALQLAGPYIIVSQTTQDEAAFAALARRIEERFPGGQVFNTICNSTHKRQEEVRNLCTRAQAIVVVGGRSSANTKRLAEIAESLGRPVFPVETEDDLELDRLSQYECVGVTAGASTPTWLINRVVAALESVRSQGQSQLSQIVYKVLRRLLETNLYVSAGGGGLAYVCALLQDRPPSALHFVTAFGYLFAMHNCNRFANQEAEEFNDPPRAHLFRAFRWPLIVGSVLALAGALIVAYAGGMGPFLVLLGMSILGVLYSVPLVPRSLRPIMRTRGLKEIPGSKTFFVAMAWAVVVTVLPLWEDRAAPGPATLAAFVFVLLLVYVRSALFDVFEVQGDRVVGKETLPVLIGEKKTLSLLHWLVAALGLLLAVLPAAGLLAPVGVWLLPGIAYLGGLIMLYERGRIIQGIKLEFLIESLFYLLAGLAWLGSR